jgi:hypothetical protein
MTFWQFLQSIWLYFFAVPNELTLETLKCPPVETLDRDPKNKALSNYFNTIITKKKDGDILHRFNDQDIFQKTSDPDTMIYSQAIPLENIEYDLQAMRIHKEISDVQSSKRMIVTELKEIRCVMLQKEFYFFMNDETKCDGAMPGVLERDPIMLKDFRITPFRLDFYNRILDKFNEFVKLGYKFKKLLKGQILFRKIDIEGVPPRLYDPMFDMYYWTTTDKVEPTEENPNPPTDRFDIFMVTLVLMQIEFDFHFTRTKNTAADKVANISEEILNEAKFPENLSKIDMKTRKSVPKLIFFTSSVLDMTISIEDSASDIQVAREMLEFFTRLILVFGKQRGMSESEYNTTKMFFESLVSACMNNENIIKRPNLDYMIQQNLESLEHLIDKEKVSETIV